MSKSKLTLIAVIALIFFLGSLLLFLTQRDSLFGGAPEVSGRSYRNENLGYVMTYPYEWEIREDDGEFYFHPLFANDNLPETEEEWDSYRSNMQITLEGRSPLTYIDGEVRYDIEKTIYLNNNDFEVRKWYDLAAIAEAFFAQKIGEAEFIRLRREIIDNGKLSESNHHVFDPWMSRGNILDVNGRDVLKVVRNGDYQHDGYQYYITQFEDYIFVFHFGYGGPVIPREMWQRSNLHVIDMITSLRSI